MKKFYILFLSLPVLLSLLYISVWWAVVAVACILVFIAYRYYTGRLEAAHTINENLESAIDDLNVRLDKAVLKEQFASQETVKVKLLKQHVMSVISHEIRTPMNGIVGMTYLLQNTRLTKEQQECADSIYSCSETLLSAVNTILVNDILDFSKLQPDATPLEHKNFELQDCIEEVLELFGDKARIAGIDLLYSIDEDVPDHVLGDSRRVRQILMNLVENSIRFTNHGEIFIGVHLSSQNGPGKTFYLEFEVRDTGTGIAGDQLEHLFKGIQVKEFQNGNDMITQGLGLVVCKKLIDLMGGSIEVISQPGNSTVFTFNIPMVPGPKKDITVDHHTRTLMQGKYVLVVDDNASSRAILIKKLRTWGCQPVSASSANEAMEILSQKKIHLVLTDTSLPGTENLQPAKAIRKKYHTMAIIGMNTPGDTLFAQDPATFTSIITKPVRQHLLKDKLIEIFTSSAVHAGKSLQETFAEQYPLRILIAEDNKVNQKIATRILTKMGYEPAVASNGKEAIELVSYDHYDVVLMDVQMPEMNGLEATRMIRTCLEIQPVIIALTANVMQGDRDECMQAGMDDYMSKPIELKELLRLLEKWALMIRSRRKHSAGVRP